MGTVPYCMSELEDGSVYLPQVERLTIKDEACPGRPVTTMTGGNIAAVKKAVEDDACCTVEVMKHGYIFMSLTAKKK